MKGFIALAAAVVLAVSLAGETARVNAEPSEQQLLDALMKKLRLLLLPIMPVV